LLTDLEDHKKWMKMHVLELESYPTIYRKKRTWILEPLTQSMSKEGKIAKAVRVSNIICFHLKKNILYGGASLKDNYYKY
jgi:hypothetical protein